MLKVGDRMPFFEVMDQNGNKFNSLQLLGRKTIIYFYPKDNTSGCTAQACSLRDNYTRLVAEGYNVIGISKDSVNSHKNFASKYDLPFTLLSDTSTEILRRSVHGERRRCMGRLPWARSGRPSSLTKRAFSSR